MECLVFYERGGHSTVSIPDIDCSLIGSERYNAVGGYDGEFEFEFNVV